MGVVCEVGWVSDWTLAKEQSNVNDRRDWGTFLHSKAFVSFRNLRAHTLSALFFLTLRRELTLIVNSCYLFSVQRQRAKGR